MGKARNLRLRELGEVKEKKRVLDGDRNKVLESESIPCQNQAVKKENKNYLMVQKTINNK